MCRLYGFRANEPTKVECTLVHAQNALLIQSRADRRGVAHADGWGIACYENGAPVVERRSLAAHDDITFSETAERIYAKTVVAHVRRATVGAISPENTHPFRFGRWVFAHNGTLTAFEAIRAKMESETLPEVQKGRLGQTDSEQAFLWLLSRIARAGIDLEKSSKDVLRLGDVLARAVARLAHWCAEAGAKREAKLNFLLTDGQSMLASRWSNSLYWVRRDGVHDCEICGIPHIEHDATRRYLAVVLASEPISDETWQTVPERHVLSVGEDMVSAVHPIPS